MLRFVLSDIHVSHIISKVNTILLRQNHCMIAIDGMCGSGKSTVSAYLAAELDAQVFHMDDFYVPSHLKTKERLRTPGSNVHYERFFSEVLEPLAQKLSIKYKPYNCATESFYSEEVIPYHNVNIIEGSYSMHPKLIDYYDLKIFLSVSEDEQQSRIAKRNGPEGLERFKRLWIPLENEYFKAYAIQNQADLILDMTTY
jgi:uridine kinase